MGVLLALICLFAFVNCDKLRCYDCDPSFPSKCISVNDDQKVICDTDNFPGDEYECVTLFYKTDLEETTGVYRGCVEKQEDILSSCDYLAMTFGDNMTLCETCTGDLCNDRRVENEISGLKCYDCDPTIDGCITPRKYHTKRTICGDDANHDCFSLYFDSYLIDSPSGVYRGCIETPNDYKSTCDYLQESLTFGNVTHCQSCNGDFCNVHRVEDQKEVLSDKSNPSILASIFVVMTMFSHVSVIIFFCF